MNLSILEQYNSWLNYYSDLQTFCPYSDALEQCANYICEAKPKWTFERSLKFITQLRTR